MATNKPAATATATTPPAWWPQTLIDETEAGKLLGVSPETLRDWRCRRTVPLPFVKIGAAVRYVPSDLWEYLNAHTVRPAAVCA